LVVKGSTMTIRRVFLLALLVAIPATAQNRPAPSRTELAPGIFHFTTPSYGDVGLDGNSTGTSTASTTS
jgi:hypothetical protein